MGRIAGIDYGAARIGIAMADEETGIAGPFATYARRGPEADLAYFQDLARSEAVKRFVVGLPVHLDGGESRVSTEARRFGEWLHAATGVEVVYFDERFTTSEARDRLIESGLPRKRRKGLVDRLAAQVLLASYLEAPHKAGESPRGLDDRS
jgi:putative Holliday junction resolvase